MENELENRGKSGIDDESFRLDDMDEYPNEIPNNNQQPSANSQQPSVNSRQTEVRRSKGPLLALLLIAGLALIVMFSALVYDWGVNRGGFDDIAGIFGKEKKVIVKEKEIIIEKDLPEYNEYMDTAGANIPDEEIIIEEESIEQPEINEKPKIKQKNTETQKPKETKSFTQKQTQDSKVDLEKVPYPESITNRIQKSPVKEAEQYFTVQVYATPSQDDAEAWKEKLLKQNIPDVSISLQKIKNRDWYRVRFGTFKSVDEARKAATSTGFAHSWIDRVK